MISITDKSTWHVIKKNARQASGVFFVSLLSGCASTPQTSHLLSLPTASLTPHVELSDVPFFPQEAYQCGPAALATMLSTEQNPISPDDLVDKVYIPEKKGSLQIEMIATARQFGVLTYPIDKNLTTLVREVESGRPVLVFQNLAFNWAPQWHYAVVVGYDIKDQLLTLRSGTTKQHKMKLSTFEQTWARGEYWGYVFAQPGQIPVTASPFPYLKAVETLDQAGFTQHAFTSYKAAEAKWPDFNLVHVMLGNSYYQHGELSAAQTSFEKSINLNPDDANTWNNYAYVLQDNGCQTQAYEAIQCALALEPNDPNIQSSYDEIKAGKSQTVCPVLTCPVQ
jgi:tetratricopeptide (TPR) repeat protein